MIVRTNLKTNERRGDPGFRRSGFTLMEMLIVVAIIVIIASLGGFYVMKAYDTTRETEAKLKAKTIGKAIDSYKIDHGEFPQSLQQLVQISESGKGPYLTTLDQLNDPWGRPYQYDISGQKNSQASGVPGVIIPDVYTTGPDGKTLGNWNDPLKK